jgi:hypothetical protein
MFFLGAELWVIKKDLSARRTDKSHHLRIKPELKLMMLTLSRRVIFNRFYADYSLIDIILSL